MTFNSVNKLVVLLVKIKTYRGRQIMGRKCKIGEMYSINK